MIHAMMMTMRDEQAWHRCQRKGGSRDNFGGTDDDILINCGHDESEGD